MIEIYRDLYYEPLSILEQLDSEKTDMSEQQLAFICGLIKKYKPKKMVEIGVAAGVTTSVILNCISILNYDTKVFSLDLSENFYEEPDKKTGYAINKCKKIIGNNLNHTLLTGKFSVEYLKYIGENIDFLILDTVHSLPGELLDFLAFYPYLKSQSIVVLHDIILNHCSNNFNAYATKILFDTVVAEKLWIWDDEYNAVNIGAFRINEDTGKYIENVFSALTITWRYMPGDVEISLYRNHYQDYYSCELLRIFDMAVRFNEKTFNKSLSVMQDEFRQVLQHIESLRDKNIYIYGCGHIGIQLHRMLSVCGIKVEGYLITDGQEKTKIYQNIYYLSEVNLNNENDLVYIGVSEYLYSEILYELETRNINTYILPDKGLLKYLT